MNVFYLVSDETIKFPPLLGETAMNDHHNVEVSLGELTDDELETVWRKPCPTLCKRGRT